jgi:predicted nucleotidyltransferase
MPGRKQHIIQLIRQKVNEIDNSAEVILYGSRARGDAKKDSDWDILILTNYPVSVEIERSFRNNLFDLEIETGEVFSTFVYQKQDWNTRHNVTPLYHNIKREGVRI